MQKEFKKKKDDETLGQQMDYKRDNKYAMS